VSFQFEPIAAALDYEQQVTGEETRADRRSRRRHLRLFGGAGVAGAGPQAADREQDILATAGVHVGGTDFDRLLSLASAMPPARLPDPDARRQAPLPSGPYADLATWHRINRLYTPDTLRELRQHRARGRGARSGSPI
jgi:hypothetical chaperone protein